MNRLLNTRKGFILTSLALFVAQGMFAQGAQNMDAARVRLFPGSPFHDRQELHRKGYLSSYEPGRLLYDYRRFAGLSQSDGVTGGYPGWDTSWLRGHMAGHYLSAVSRMAVATGDESFKAKANVMVAGFAQCQDAINQEGYLAAFPSGAFDRLEGKPGNGGGVVVPYYIIHKTMAGLLDAHHYLGNEQALEVAKKMGDYFTARLSKVSTEQLEKMFRTDVSGNPQNEFGAMSNVLAQLHEVTDDQKYLGAAQLFNRSWLMDPLMQGEDKLAGLHGNTHVAQVVGIAHCGNISGNENEVNASENFWKFVTRNHSFVIGGNSVHEWFDKSGVEVGPSIDGDKVLPPTTAETCNTHNMLKLTSYLFERNQDAEYADFYERALYNHVLASMAPDTGAVTYFMPMRGHFKTYLNGTHCCVGSGIENTPRYNEGIYYQQGRSLWVNLYIPSELDWQKVGMVLRQEGDVTRGEPIRFTVVKASVQANILNFRVPHWIADAAVLTLNGDVVKRESKPSTYVSLERVWKTGDVVTLTLPAALRLEHAKDNAALVSVFYGPVLLAGELGRDNMPDNDHADKDAHLKYSAVPVPKIVSTSIDPAHWLRPVEGDTLAFHVNNAGLANGIVFRPLYEVHHQRYSVYWNVERKTNVR